MVKIYELGDRMDIEYIIQTFQTYGLVFLFIIVFLEYLNLPGLPAGIIMPAAGVLIKAGDMNFIVALLVSVIAGLLGSYVLYGIGHYVGHPILDQLYNRFASLQKGLDKLTDYHERYGDKAVFIARLIPVARTLISLTAGVFSLKLSTFTVYSVAGITLWNTAYILAGYLFGHLM